MITLDKESLFSKARQSVGFLMRVYFVAQNLYYNFVGGYADLINYWSNVMNIISDNTIMKNVRASDLVLDRKFNPAESPDVETLNNDYLVESCGLIPDFFADACLLLELDHGGASIDFFAKTGATPLDTIADTMNTIYGSGGFYSGFGGSLDEHGCYVSKYSEEEPMPPFARFRYDHFVCYVYDCAVTVLFDLQTRQTITGRFD